MRGTLLDILQVASPRFRSIAQCSCLEETHSLLAWNLEAGVSYQQPLVQVCTIGRRLGPVR